MRHRERMWQRAEGERERIMIDIEERQREWIMGGAFLRRFQRAAWSLTHPAGNTKSFAAGGREESFGGVWLGEPSVRSLRTLCEVITFNYLRGATEAFDRGLAASPAHPPPRASIKRNGLDSAIQAPLTPERARADRSVNPTPLHITRRRFATTLNGC